MQVIKEHSLLIGNKDQRSRPNINDLSKTISGQRPFPLRLILTGVIVLLLFIISLSVWVTYAPIESAVVSQGIIGVSSHRKIIQHLEGGIVDKIFVHDGDRVKKGQLLVKLRDVQQKSELRKLERQLLEAQAVMARLQAEINGDEKISFPEEISRHISESSINSVIVGQNNVLESLRALNSDKLSVLQNKIVQAEEEIKGITDQLNAKTRQKSFVKKELDSTLQAIEKKLIPKTKAFSLRERLAEIEGEISAYRSKRLQLKQSTHEIQFQISETKAQYLAEATQKLREQRALVFELSQMIVSAQDILQRTKIASPIDGIVVNLQLHTQDGVIAAGKSILEIVPTNDDLVVHTFINPEDIDEVHAGMAAVVQLTSLSRRQRLPMEGVVTDISADRLSNPETGQDYYSAIVNLNRDLNASGKSILIPGMGAEVFIRTGARTPLEYLLSPITKSLQLGMREQ
jgi:HlyD family type I secretion membrane fusion protein